MVENVIQNNHGIEISQCECKTLHMQRTICLKFLAYVLAIAKRIVKLVN